MTSFSLLAQTQSWRSCPSPLEVRRRDASRHQEDTIRASVNYATSMAFYLFSMKLCVVVVGRARILPSNRRARPLRPRSAAKSVHFDQSEPEIIPPREDEDEYEVASPTPGAELEEHDHDHEEEVGAELGEGEKATVLYDFVADGEDEMSVHEGQVLLVLERDADDWWKCRNGKGEEGVVPANYLEVSGISHVLLWRSCFEFWWLMHDLSSSYQAQ